MLMPPDAEPVMPASAVDGNSFVHQRIGDRRHGVGDDSEPGEQRDHRPETIFRGGVRHLPTGPRQ